MIEPPKTSNYSTIAIINIVLCWPIGIISWYFSKRIDKLVRIGDDEKAIQYSQIIKILFTISLFLSICTIFWAFNKIMHKV